MNQNDVEKTVPRARRQMTARVVLKTVFNVMPFSFSSSAPLKPIIRKKWCSKFKKQHQI
jgi:hypothetical protein